MTFLLLSLGILLLPGPRSAPRVTPRTRRSVPLPVLAAVGSGVIVIVLGGRLGWLLAGPAAVGAARVTRRIIRSQRVEVDRSAYAFVLELIAAALSTGLPVETAVGAVDAAVQRYGDERLRAAAAPFSLVGRLLALGSDPVRAWDELRDRDGLVSVAAAGRRCAHSGARLAGAFAEAAAELRAQHRLRLLAKAQRTGVWALLPLGLCFLPAFVCLGVVPVVIGVAGQVQAGFT